MDSMSAMLGKLSAFRGNKTLKTEWTKPNVYRLSSASSFLLFIAGSCCCLSYSVVFMSHSLIFYVNIYIIKKTYIRTALPWKSTQISLSAFPRRDLLIHWASDTQGRSQVRDCRAHLNQNSGFAYVWPPTSHVLAHIIKILKLFIQKKNLEQNQFSIIP